MSEVISSLKPAQEYENDSELTAFDDPAAIVAAIVISIVGAVVMMTMPVLIGALADNLGFDEQQLGWLASSDLFGSFIAAILTSFLIVRVNRHYIAIAGIITALVTNFLSAQTHDFETLICLRVLAGVGGGVCYSLGVGCLAGSHNTARNFSLLMFALTFIGAAGLYLVPILSGSWGVAGIYYAFCIIFTICLIAVPKLPAFNSEATDKVAGNEFSVQIPVYLPKLCLLAAASFYITVGSFWTYIERAGVDGGLSEELITNTLTIGTLFSLLGCVLSTWLSNRFGQSKPLIAALICMAGAMTLLAIGINPVVFIIVNFTFNVLWLFTDIYQLGTISNLDHSGRYTALMPGAQGLAQALSPSVAGFILSQNVGYGGVMVLAAAGSFGAFAVYTFVYARLRKLTPEIADSR